MAVTKKKKTTKKPETEQRLYELQKQYLENRSTGADAAARSAYQQIFSEILPYARSLILKKTTGKIYLPPDLVDSAALEATVKFMSSYEKPEFKIDSSFAGILSYKVLEALYGPKIIAADQIGSLNEHIETSKSKDTEFGDMAESFNFKYMFRPDNDTLTEDPANYLFNKNEDAINEVMTIITDLYAACTLHEFFLLSIGILHFIKKSKFYEAYRQFYLNERLRQTLDFAILEIYKRLKNVA